MVQSLARREDVRELTSRYGLVIVDECHHVPAVTFERVVRQIGASSWLGLTATPYRRDGLEGLITMYCGPVRHRMGTGLAEGMPAVERALTVHETAHLGSGDGAEVATPAIQAVFRELVDDGSRTRQVCADIAAASRAGRNCLVLSQWKEHVRLIETDLEAFGIEPAVLVGDVGRKGRRAIIARLAEARVGAGVTRRRCRTRRARARAAARAPGTEPRTVIPNVAALRPGGIEQIGHAAHSAQHDSLETSRLNAWAPILSASAIVG